MIRDQDVLDPRRAPRYTSARAARTAPTRQRRPMPDRRRPVRRNDNLRLLVAALVAVALLGGLLAVRSITRVTLTGTVLADEVVNVAGPRMSVPREMAPSVPGRVMTLRGLVDGAATMTANGDPVELDGGGGFAVHIPQAWSEVRLVATGADGEQNESVVAIKRNPARANPPVVRARRTVLS